MCRLLASIPSPENGKYDVDRLWVGSSVYRDAHVDIQGHTCIITAGSWTQQNPRLCGQEGRLGMRVDQGERTGDAKGQEGPENATCVHSVVLCHIVSWRYSMVWVLLVFFLRGLLAVGHAVVFAKVI